MACGVMTGSLSLGSVASNAKRKGNAAERASEICDFGLFLQMVLLFFFFFFFFVYYRLAQWSLRVAINKSKYPTITVYFIFYLREMHAAWISSNVKYEFLSYKSTEYRWCFVDFRICMRHHVSLNNV